MPTYSYECELCESEVFDRNVAIEDRDLQHCRSCGQKLDRKVTPPAMVWAPTAGGYR